MGTNGPGIFSDDLACDIRGDFREMIADGLTAEQATRRLIKSYGKTKKVDYDDDDPVFWTALAAVQWKCGRLTDTVKQKALEIIAHGGDLPRWELEAGLKPAAKRRAVLEKLRDLLLSPPPPPTKIRKIYHDRTSWKVGHAVGYRLLSGKWVVLRVLGISDDGKSLTPIVDMCDWVGSELPDPSRVAAMRRRRTLNFDSGGRGCAAEQLMGRQWAIKHDGKFTVYSLGPRDFPADRVRVIGTRLKVEPTRKNEGGETYFGGWKRLDAYLADAFGLK